MAPAALAQGARNLVQTGVLLAGMAALLAAVGWGLAGSQGVFMALGAGIGVLLFAPEMSGRLAMQAMDARQLSREAAPLVFRMLDTVSRRAGLPAPPVLYYLPHPIPQAFSIGQRAETAAICLSEGMLRILGTRELAAVLAHEIAHILHRDLHVMMLADMITRLTRTMSFAGLLLLVFNGVIFMAGQAGGMPWWLPWVLMLAPTASALMQSALSRTREFEADREAARLTGDPMGLVAALALLEARNRGLWERMFGAGGDRLEPSLLRTHPHTEERIARLKAQVGDEAPLRALLQPDAMPLLGPPPAGTGRPSPWLWWWR